MKNNVSPAVAQYIKLLARAMRETPVCEQCQSDSRCEACKREAVQYAHNLQAKGIN